MPRNAGSAFRKTDLHIHTPKSACFSEKSAAPEKIVHTALQMGLEAIGITDHNTVSAIDDIRKAAEKKNLSVFPGVELSTRGGHVLALFDLNTPMAELEAFLDTVGISHKGRGDAITLAKGGMETILEKISVSGGLAVAAHIERFPSGFLESNEPRSTKMRIHANPYLSALEITIPQNKTRWNSGKVRGYPKTYACIQGSDAHALTEIGRRPVYIRMEQINLSALRQAFLGYEELILFPEEIPSGK
jgi:PHP family Zn ribbon phosphoesterase